MKKRLSLRRIEEKVFQAFMLLAFGMVVSALGFILVTILVKGLPSINLAMLTETPQGGYYLGKGGGILNAIAGSLDLAVGATLLALLFSLPLALFLQAFAGSSRWALWVRLALDVLWGIPSIVYGAFGFTLMLAMGLRSSLLGGILALALLELPILTRSIDEVIQMLPPDLSQASFALGANRLETAIHVITRQVLPGIITAVLLAFGRGIGDAASVLFTAGYTDRLPNSLLRPVASLPLAIFFQLGTPYPEVQQRGYAAALILTAIVLTVSLGARFLSRRLGRFTIK